MLALRVHGEVVLEQPLGGLQHNNTTPFPALDDAFGTTTRPPDSRRSGPATRHECAGGSSVSEGREWRAVRRSWADATGAAADRDHRFTPINHLVTRRCRLLVQTVTRYLFLIILLLRVLKPDVGPDLQKTIDRSTEGPFSPSSPRHHASMCERRRLCDCGLSAARRLRLASRLVLAGKDSPLHRTASTGPQQHGSSAAGVVT